MFPDDSLDLYYTAVSPVSCRVIARARGRSAADGWSLRGALRGPECAECRMLPATHTFRSLAPKPDEEDAFAMVEAPDPCFWSPQLPAFYRVDLELVRHGQTAERFSRTIAIRPLGVRGVHLYWESKRWVLRGVCRESARETDLSAWRQAGAAMVVSRPEDALCEQATQRGVLLVARLSGSENELIQESRRLAKWGAVAMVLLDEGARLTDAVRFSAPNLLFLETGTKRSGSAPALLAVPISETPAPHVASGGMPMVAMRTLPAPEDLAEARAACDRLQRDLAPGDWAGYIV